MATPATPGPRTEDSRQWSLASVVSFAATDIAEGVVIELQPGTVITGGNLVITTAFNGTTPTLTATDNSVTPISFFGAAAATAVGHTALAAGAGTYYPQGGTVTFAATGSPTAGAAIFELEYFIVGRTNEAYGN